MSSKCYRLKRFESCIDCDYLRLCFTFCRILLWLSGFHQVLSYNSILSGFFFVTLNFNTYVSRLALLEPASSPVLLRRSILISYIVTL